MSVLTFSGTCNIGWTKHKTTVRMSKREEKDKAKEESKRGLQWIFHKDSHLGERGNIDRRPIPEQLLGWP